MLPSVIVVDAELVVRRRSLSDAAQLASIIVANMSHLQRYMPFARPGYSIDDARKFITDSLSPVRAETTLGGNIHYRGTIAGDIELRGGSGCLNSGARSDKWNRASLGQAATGAGSEL